MSVVPAGNPRGWSSGPSSVLFRDDPAFQYLWNSAYLRQTDIFAESDPDRLRFMNAWTQPNESFLSQMEEYNPVAYSEYNDEWEWRVAHHHASRWSGVDFPPYDYFATPTKDVTEPESGTMNIFYAVMAVGIGACKAAAEPSPSQTSLGGSVENITMTGEVLQDGIRDAVFHGSTREVRFGDRFPGSRAGSTVSFSVFNIVINGSFEYAVTEYRNASDGHWHSIKPFKYRDGSTSPPEPFQNPPDQNYLSGYVRITGLVLAAMAYLVAVVSRMWLIAYRRHPVVVASQPPLLIVMCLGSCMQAVAIIVSSYDEGQGWTEEELSMACTTLPWLISLEHIVTYTMLFTKLFRINKVLQFSRKKVDIKHVIWPALLMEVLAVVLLSIWTATTEFGWERVVTDTETGESIGKCAGDKEDLAFLIPILLLALIPTLLTAIMAWKTIDVDAAYSEAKWIFALILVQCQVCCGGSAVDNLT